MASEGSDAGPTSRSEGARLGGGSRTRPGAVCRGECQGTSRSWPLGGDGWLRFEYLRWLHHLPEAGAGTWWHDSRRLRGDSRVGDSLRSAAISRSGGVWGVGRAAVPATSIAHLLGDHVLFRRGGDRRGGGLDLA